MNHIETENVQLAMMLRKAKKQQMCCFHQLKLVKNVMVVNLQQKKLGAHARNAIAFTVKI